MVDLYSLRVPPESFLAVRYFVATDSRLIDMVTTPRPSTFCLDARLHRRPIAGECGSLPTSCHRMGTDEAAAWLHTSPKIVRKSEETAS